MFKVKVNVSSGSRQFPAWNARGRVRKVNEEGDIVQGQYAFNSEAVRISPRFQKGGTNYRVRPERPAAFFAAFCNENNLLPSLLTAEEAESEWGLELLQPLWEEHQFQFPKLESPFAASDDATEPSLRLGFSFCVPQVLVEPMGVARTNQAAPAFRPSTNGTSTVNLEAARKRIEEMRARAGANGSTPPKKKKSYDATALLNAIADQKSDPPSAA